MMKITVIGCGWLGMPLAQRFVEAGMEVSGTVRTVDKLDQLSDLGIRPILYSGSISQELMVDLQTTDLLIICFPPSGSPDYAAQITQLIDIVSEKTRVIFTSSTGVYKEKLSHFQYRRKNSPNVVVSGKILFMAHINQNNS